MYIIWEILILGSLPPGMSIGSVREVLQLLGGNRVVLASVNVFSLFAIVTSLRMLHGRWNGLPGLLTRYDARGQQHLLAAVS